MAQRKWYVVFVGSEPGICETWEDCEARVKGFPGARYKGFSSLEEALEAKRKAEDGDYGIIRALAKGPKEVVNYSAIPEIIPGSIAVDGACSGNPGVMEYQGVEIDTGVQLFHKKFNMGTNNIGEFLALVHALALYSNDPACQRRAIYTDSKTAMAWVRERHCKTKIAQTAANKPLFDVIHRAEQWLQTHQYANPIIKWKTEEWGEIPADFGRK